MNAPLTVGGVFDGVGLLAYGLHLAGLEHRWLCEVDPFRRSVLERRWPGVPVYTDVRAVGADLCEPVDVIAGGFPCKGASTAGKRTGFSHPETVLWREMARAVGELVPRYVLVENVANLLAIHDGAVWGEVLGDLAALGYDVAWDCLPAAAVGAPHLRDRVFAVAAYSQGEHRQAGPPASGSLGRAARRGDGAPANTEGKRRTAPAPINEWPRVRTADGGGPAVACGGQDHRGVAVEWGAYEPAIRRWEAVHGPAPEPLVRRVDDRSARRVERSRLSALGDGVQVQLGQIVGEHIVSLEAERGACARNTEEEET